MDELSEEKYIEVSNKFSMFLAELGVDNISLRDKTIEDLFNLSKDENKTEESLKKEISDLFYSVQLNCLMDGIEKCIKIVTSLFEKNGWVCDFLSLDNALKYLFDYAKDSDILFNSSEELADIAKEYFYYMNEDEIKYHSPEFIEELTSTTLQFLDNSYLLGLTDTRSLYHALTKYFNPTVDPESITKELDQLFPDIY